MYSSICCLYIEKLRVFVYILISINMQCKIVNMNFLKLINFKTTHHFQCNFPPSKIFPSNLFSVYTKFSGILPMSSLSLLQRLAFQKVCLETLISWLLTKRRQFKVSSFGSCKYFHVEFGVHLRPDYFSFIKDNIYLT